MGNVRDVRATEVIKAVEKKIGYGKILAVRPKQTTYYEITMEQEDFDMKEK